MDSEKGIKQDAIAECGFHDNMIEKGFCIELRKSKVVTTSVAELMKTLKSKRKGHIDKGKSK